MSAIPQTTSDDRDAQILDAHGGDSEAALLTCLREIDRLAAAFERVSYQTSRGYAYGATRRTTHTVPATTTTAREPLDV